MLSATKPQSRVALGVKLVCSIACAVQLANEELTSGRSLSVDVKLRQINEHLRPGAEFCRGNLAGPPTTPPKA
ncbi:hypothetical protein LshimejAT787_2600350 [Lyophyllum shimeji]|uniref:Uncharacterized protein n=1 Tax=Lyophyllum shimeji TaxID=47721 RepID=A0A9P3UV16_LYOSH|nr:hypothetical protein LshimejAT787_2600350 [Lyophyllum shimeji]